MGFAFHKSNIDILGDHRVLEGKRMIATAFGMSPFEIEAVRKRLNYRPIELLHDVDCVDLMKNHFDDWLDENPEPTVTTGSYATEFNPYDETRA